MQFHYPDHLGQLPPKVEKVINFCVEDVYAQEEY